jgi:flagellar biosynthesis protein FlhG
MAELSSLQRHSLIEELSRLERDADIVIVDNGAGLSRSIRAFLNFADAPLVVATPEPTSIADAYALIKCVMLRRDREQREDRAPRGQGEPVSPISLLVSQCAGRREAEAVHGRIATVCAKFLGCPVPLAGWVSQDVRVGRSIRQRRPLLVDDPRAQAARDIDHLAEQIVSDHIRGSENARARPRKRALARFVRWMG